MIVVKNKLPRSLSLLLIFTFRKVVDVPFSLAELLELERWFVDHGPGFFDGSVEVIRADFSMIVIFTIIIPIFHYLDL